MSRTIQGYQHFIKDLIKSKGNVCSAADIIAAAMDKYCEKSGFCCFKFAPRQAQNAKDIRDFVSNNLFFTRPGSWLISSLEPEDMFEGLYNATNTYKWALSELWRLAYSSPHSAAHPDHGFTNLCRALCAEISTLGVQCEAADNEGAFIRKVYQPYGAAVWEDVIKNTNSPRIILSKLLNLSAMLLNGMGEPLNLRPSPDKSKQYAQKMQPVVDVLEPLAERARQLSTVTRDQSSTVRLQQEVTRILTDVRAVIVANRSNILEALPLHSPNVVMSAGGPAKVYNDYILVKIDEYIRLLNQWQPVVGMSSNSDEHMALSPAGGSGYGAVSMP